VLESLIFAERKRDGFLKARQVAGGNKQQVYITKEDASSPTVSSESVMLTCVIDATKKREVAVVDIPNAFIQNVVEDEKDRAFICICGPLVDILGSIAPDVYGPYVTVGKKGEKQLLVQCLTALYGTMVAAPLPRPSVAVAVTVRKIIGLKKISCPASLAPPIIRLFCCCRHSLLYCCLRASPPPILTSPPPPPQRGTSRACRPRRCHQCAIVGDSIVIVAVTVTVSVAVAVSVTPV
jgi:hypothetical protein